VFLSGLIHGGDVPGRKVEMGPLSATWTDLGKAGGSVETGLKRIRIDPDCRSTPVHVHDAEEEIFYVLEGSGLSWQDGATCDIGPGDCIVQVAGGKGHTLVAGPDGLEVLAFGTRRQSPFARLPRAGVAWAGPSWVRIGDEPHPWARELAAGELDVPAPGPRPANVVALDDVEEVAVCQGDTDRRQRALGLAAGSRLTGLNYVVVRHNRLNCPPHVHAAEEEIFVLLEGDGTVLAYDCDSRPPQLRVHAVTAGDVLVRPAGTGVAHAFMANALGITLLAYGQRRSDEMTFYPRSGKVRFRGLGVTGRLALCDYWDGEPPEDVNA
jgi:uncharacterized cupin superfamily protein